MTTFNSTHQHAQITLELFTTDEHLIEIAKAYWEVDDDGKWIKITEIENRFGISRGHVSKLVTPICVAYAPSVVCDECHHPLGFSTRAKLEDALLLIRKKRRQRFLSYRAMCLHCQKDLARKQLAEIETKARATHLAIKNRLESLHASPHVLDYQSMTLKQAFLLDGLLRSAGDSWQGEVIDAWVQAEVKLCDTEDDIRSVYSELYNTGWIRPCPTSPLDSFTVDEKGQLTFDVLRTRWTIAHDSSGLLFHDLLIIAESVQRHATPEQLRQIWEWVCLCELKGYYYWCRNDLSLRDKGWTPAMERGALDLLSECSLGSAKRIMRSCCERTVLDLKRNIRPAAHTYNMLPGRLRRTFDYYTAKGWAVEPYHRQAVSVEPIFTNHLFDKILNLGGFGYENLVGNSFSNLSQLTYLMLSEPMKKETL